MHTHRYVTHACTWTHVCKYLAAPAFDLGVLHPSHLFVVLNPVSSVFLLRFTPLVSPYFFIFCLFFVFLGQGFTGCSSGCPWTHFVARAGLDLTAVFLPQAPGFWLCSFFLNDE